MNKTEILRKAQSDEGMTVAEINWTIADLPEYLHGIDRQARRMYDTMYAKLSASEQFQKTGDFIKDLQIETEIQRRIDEEILNELVYV